MRLRTIREEKGLTQEQLAVRAGMSQEYIARLETGTKANPSLASLTRLADALGVEIGALFEQKRAKRMLTVAEAHIPTWLKLQLSDAARGANRMTYAAVGWHLGRYHAEDFELEEHGLGDVTDEEIEKHATRTLRRLFRNEEHPRAEFVDLIPSRRRRDFLRGLVYGLADEPFPEWNG